jgi:hypothetical protein
MNQIKKFKEDEKMIKTAIEYLMNAGKPEVIDVDGINYSTKKIERIHTPAPSVIRMNTLTGLIDYVSKNVDSLCLDEENYFVHVVSEKYVKFYSPLLEDAARDCFLECEASTPRLMLDTYIDLEKFNVMLQSCFLDAEDRSKVLSFIGNIREEKVKNTSDDGVSQQVLCKSGIATVENATVPNPVTLVPFRTFIEVEQLSSKFVLRIKDGPQIALFEADGGEWRLLAMLRIKEYLETAFAEKNIKITVLA